MENNSPLVLVSSSDLMQMIEASVSKAVKSIGISQAIPEDEFMSIEAAAKFVGLVVPTLYSLVSRGEIPVCKRARRLYFSKQDLAEWIKSGRKKTTAELSAEVKAYIKKYK